MVTMYVTYSGDADATFDRDYWLNSHLPLVRECWGPHGLQSAAGFFPDGDGAGLIAICPCVFRDEAALRAALSASETQRVMTDVKNFTDIIPQRCLAVPV